MNAMDRLLAKDACITLMTAYCTHLDERNEAQFLDLFTTDAHFARLAPPAYEASGHDGIRLLLAARPASLLSRHMMLNHEVVIDTATTAHAKALGIVVRGDRDRTDLPMPIRGLELLVQYQLEFRCEAGQWKICRCGVLRLMDVEARV